MLSLFKIIDIHGISLKEFFEDLDTGNAK